MRGNSKTRVAGIGLAAVLAVLLGQGMAKGEESLPVAGEPTLPLTRTAGLPTTIRMAVLDARRRLDGLRCRQIFSEFRDAEGHPLQERLDAMGQSGQSYLEWMLFYDGRDGRPCREANVLATTEPGSRIVFYCGQRFAALRKRSAGTLTSVVIHEELHSLGLEENPPSSQEITQAVTRHCGG